MKKGINILVSLGFILIVIGVLFGLKTKFLDNSIKVFINSNSTTYLGNKMLKIKKGTTGKIKIDLNITGKGFYSIQLNLPEKLELYEDKELTKKINNLYKFYYEESNQEIINIYYNNQGNDYEGKIELNVKQGKLDGTMLNKATEKEYFWSDEYRPLIENIDFELINNFICEENCFDISSNISKVYAKLISKDNKYDLKIISDTTIYLPKNSSYMFDNFENLKTINFNNIDTKYVENMEYMFSNNKNIEEIDLSKFNTSNVINMTGLFRNDEKLKTIDLSNFTFNENLEYNYMFKNINSESLVYVKTAFEQAWIFGLNIYIRPGTWTINNIIIK